LKIFHGSLEEAKKVALIDQDQFVVTRILAYRGEPLTRSTMEFEVEYADGDVIWKVYDHDLSQSVPFENYCRSKPELTPLIYSQKEANRMRVALNKSPITEVQPGDTVYVDLRSYGATWYHNLPLPDKDHTTYYLAYRYTRWIGRQKLKIEAYCPVFNEYFDNLDRS
jgi:hypothetical protein